MFEYKDMAKYYDLFYKNKSYEKEVEFITQLIGNRKSILRCWMWYWYSYVYFRKY